MILCFSRCSRGSSYRAAAPRVLCIDAFTNLPKRPCPLAQTHQTAGLRCCWARRSRVWDTETAPVSAAGPADHRLDSAGLLQPHRYRYSRKRILTPGPHRYWRYLLTLLVFSYVLVLCALVDFACIETYYLAGCPALAAASAFLYLLNCACFPTYILSFVAVGKT